MPVSPEVAVYSPRHNSRQLSSRPFDLHYYLDKTLEFNQARPGFGIRNADSDFMPPYWRGERNELIAELNLYGTDAFKKEALASEAVDTLLIVWSFIVCAGVEIDQHQIWSRVNGQARPDYALDYMESLSGDITPRNLEAPLQELLVWNLSLLNHLPVHVNLPRIFDKVQAVRKRNYPAMFFTGTNVLGNGERLTTAEATAQFNFSLAALREIRNRAKRPQGLRPTDYLPHADLIHDFEHSDLALGQLTQALARQYAS